MAWSLNSDYLSQLLQGNTTTRPSDNLAYRYITQTASPYSNQGISDIYSSALKNQQATIDKQIEAGKIDYQNSIAKAPETYQPLRNEAYTTDQTAQKTLRERLANMGLGATGGQSMTLENQRDMSLQNRLGEINRQQQSVIDTANLEISKLVAQGEYQKAQAVADNATALNEALLNDFYQTREYNLNKDQYEQEKKLAEQDRYYQMLQDKRISEKQFKEYTGISVKKYKSSRGGSKNDKNDKTGDDYANGNTETSGVRDNISAVISGIYPY